MSSRRTPDAIDVVIVNYRTGPLVVSCLESLAAEIGQDLRLRAFVIDNASGDGSEGEIEAAIAREGWDWVRLIRSPINGGFGAGNNLGIDAALGDDRPAGLIWLLNPDTRIMPGAARELGRFAARTPGAGIIGTALLEGDGTPWPFAFRFPSILGEVERGLRWRLASRLLARHAVPRRMGLQPARVDWVSGASLAIRTELLEEGLRFDEDYFLYYEETDLCRTVRDLGWECWYLPQALVLHIAGQSTGVTDSRSGARRMPGYWFESRHRYFRKNHGAIYALAADLAWMTSHALFLAKQVLRREPHEDPPHLLRDFARHSAFLPQRR
jgi:GT2 family glycosyltransferase